MNDQGRARGQRVRRSMSWPMRAAISVGIPLTVGLLAAAGGGPRWVYNRAWMFWEVTGLYDPTPIPYPARGAYRARPPLDRRLRYATEGALYAVFLVPAACLSLVVYDRLTFHHARDGFLHCPGCGHVLQGLSAPRCPECGRAI